MPPPFPTDSDEVRALAKYMADSGVAHVVTTTTNHKATTNAGYPSNHLKEGTHGRGLAVDFAERIGGGRDTPGLRKIFDALARRESAFSELIYAKAPFNIRNGKRVAPYAVSDHHDHVHAAVPLGVFIKWPGVPTIPEASRMLNKPACAILPTRSGHGYWIVAQDGGVFYYGDAAPHPEWSLASQHLNAPIVAAALNEDETGLWLLGADGGVFNRGTAGFFGSPA